MGRNLLKTKIQRAMVVGLLVLFAIVILLAGGPRATTNPTVTWPTKGWPKGTPATVGLDEAAAISDDLSAPDVVTRLQWSKKQSLGMVEAGGVVLPVPIENT